MEACVAAVYWSAQAKSHVNVGQQTADHGEVLQRDMEHTNSPVELPGKGVHLLCSYEGL